MYYLYIDLYKWLILYCTTSTSAKVPMLIGQGCDMVSWHLITTTTVVVECCHVASNVHKVIPKNGLSFI